MTILKQLAANAKAAKPRPVKKPAKAKKAPRPPGMTEQTAQRHRDWWHENYGRRLRRLRSLVESGAPYSTIKEAFSMAGRDGIAIGMGLIGHEPKQGRR